MNILDKIAILEGLLFINGEDGIDFKEANHILAIDQHLFMKLINELEQKYALANSGLMLIKVAGRYKLTTKPEHLSYYQNFIDSEANHTLSPAALETLAIIAYNEPVTRLEVDDIRGVSSANMIRKLVNLEFVKEEGRSDKPGRPYLYKTTNYFLDYFNINSISELPALEISEKVVDTNQDLYYTKYQED